MLMDYEKKYVEMLEDHIVLLKENEKMKQDMSSLKGNIRAIQIRNDKLVAENAKLAAQIVF